MLVKGCKMATYFNVMHRLMVQCINTYFISLDALNVNPGSK
jgi:hypothetical protein